jgi:hypothetical protein
VRFIRRNAIALTALVTAMSGTGIAATHYLITSTSQIKPSVVQELRREIAHSAAVTLAASGAHAVRAHVHAAAPLALPASETE